MTQPSYESRVLSTDLYRNLIKRLDRNSATRNALSGFKGSLTQELRPGQMLVAKIDLNAVKERTQGRKSVRKCLSNDKTPSEARKIMQQGKRINELISKLRGVKFTSKRHETEIRQRIRRNNMLSEAKSTSSKERSTFQIYNDRIRTMHKYLYANKLIRKLILRGGASAS